MAPSENDKQLVHITRDEKYRAQTESLRAYLDESEGREDDFANQQDVIAAGSCRWPEAREDFRTWRNVFDDETHDQSPQFYWVIARPGVGEDGSCLAYSGTSSKISPRFLLSLLSPW